MPLPTLNNIPSGDALKLRHSAGFEKRKQARQTSAFIGTTTEIGKFEQPDAIFEKIPIEQIEIVHGSTIEDAWLLPDSYEFFPLTAGPITNSMLGLRGKEKAMAEAGLGTKWTVNESGRPTSYAAVRGYLKLLTDAGCYQLVQLQLKGLMSDKLLNALVDHMRACAQASKVLGKPISCVELSLPVTLGPPMQGGKGVNSVAMTPIVSGHPKTLDKKYVQAHYRSDALADVAGEQWNQIVDWAVAYTVVGPQDASAPQVQALAPAEPLPDAADLEIAIAQATDAERLHALKAHLDTLVARGVMDGAEGETHRDLIARALDSLLDGIV